MLALYLTIWLALALFVAGEIGRSAGSARAREWAWWAFAVGLALALIHTVLAFDIVHNWVHDDAVRSTALQTEAVFGVPVGWGVYVNYLFFAVWLADAWSWRVAPTKRRPQALTWGLRGFYLLIIVNAAVIFAAPARRGLGLLIVALLAWAWTRGRHAVA